MKRLNIGDKFWRDGVYYGVVAVKNSIAVATDNFGGVIYINRIATGGLTFWSDFRKVA